MPVTASSYGTLSISDLKRANNTSIIDFGVQRVFQPIRDLLVAYNKNLAEQLSIFVEKTTQRTVGTGGAASMKAVYTDEYGVSDVQKIAGPSVMGFPLRKHEVALQWTESWFKNHTPEELAVQAEGAAQADMQNLQTALRKAIFTPVNTNFTDVLRDRMTIPVKAFANGDGYPIPPSPNGFVFNPSTHTHYMGTTGGTAGSAIQAADIDALLFNVLEHVNGGQILLYVPQDVEATMSQLQAAGTLPKYAKIVYNRQISPITVLHTDGFLQEAMPFNRITGTYGDAQVIVKPWLPAGCLLAFMSGPNTMKPIAMRVPASLDTAGRFIDQYGGTDGEFIMSHQWQDHPFSGQVWQREFGFGPMNRVAGAIMSIGSTSYTMPNIATGATAYTV